MARSVKVFVISQAKSFEAENFDVVYKAGILKSSGEFVNFVMLGSLIIGFSTLIVTKQKSTLFRIGIVIITTLGLILSIVAFNNLYYFRLE